MNEIQLILVDYVEKFKSGNVNAFDTIYDLSKKAVYYVGMNIIKNDQIVQDLMQETYIEFLQNINKIDYNRSIVAYLCTIIRNKALNYIEKSKREINLDHYENEDMYGSTSTNYDNSDLIDQIKSLLKPLEFEILLLHVIEEFSFKEISNIISKPLGTTLWMYNQAIKKVQKGLGKDYDI